MRTVSLSLAIALLAANPAAATDVCEALDSDDGVAVTLFGVLSFEDGEFYVSDGGCRMLVSLPDGMKDACPPGAEVTIAGEVDFDYGFVTDDLIVYAEEIDCP